jgi:GntR family transcriptional regulator of vanillate catabolism
MSTQLVQTVHELRNRILSGDYSKDGKLRESSLADDVGVSRTLIRLALAELEREGLVQGVPNRGYRIRTFTLDEISDAILVRGEMEAMAARISAEKGLGSSMAAQIEQILMRMDAFVDQGFASAEQRHRWIESNGLFHESLVVASNNWAIARSIDQLSRIPLVSCRAIVFDLEQPSRSTPGIRRAQDDHWRVFDAIGAGQGGRAAALMREHALASSINKRLSIDAMRSGILGPEVPGLALVA